MNGKILITGMAIFTIVFGTALWWSQTRAYYEPLSADAPAAQIRVTTLAGILEPLPISDFEGIDAFTSPLRFRGCFTTPLSLAEMDATYQPYPEATPLVTPGWFTCYDAATLSDSLADGTGRAYLGEANFVYGFDRIILITETGQGYAWHQTNPCGAAVYEGEPAPEGCPAPPERN
jgi:Family of unknown function (DUF6446)